MKVIVFASSKGGVGKTTLAFNCAIYAALAGSSVYIIDRDPTEALTRFCKKRTDDGLLDPDNPMRIEGVTSITHAVNELHRTGFARDFLIVDTPNAFMPIIRDAIEAADCVVLPVEASPVDVLVNEDVVAEVAKLGKRDRSIFVVNPVDNRSSIGDETVDVLRPMSPHLPVKITQLTDFKRSLIVGQAAVEVNKHAAAEIGKLWHAIQRVISEADHVRNEKHEDVRLEIGTGERA